MSYDNGAVLNRRLRLQNGGVAGRVNNIDVHSDGKQFVA